MDRPEVHPPTADGAARIAASADAAVDIGPYGPNLPMLPAPADAPPLQPYAVACGRCRWRTTWWFRIASGHWRGWCGRCSTWLRGDPKKLYARVDRELNETFAAVRIETPDDADER